VDGDTQSECTDIANTARLSRVHLNFFLGLGFKRKSAQVV
jgi:hypothetical protein